MTIIFLIFFIYLRVIRVNCSRKRCRNDEQVANLSPQYAGVQKKNTDFLIVQIVDVTERQFKMTLKTSLCANQSHTSEPLFPFSLAERDSRVLLSDAAIKKCC